MASTIYFLTQLPGSENTVLIGDGPPASGAYVAGDLVINCTRSAALVDEGPVGWRCITGGSPGTWISIGEALRQVDFNIIGGAAAGDYDGGVIMRGSWELVAAIERHQTKGTDGSAVTLDIVKAASGTAKSAGTSMFAAAGGFNLKGDNDTNQSATVHGTAATRQVADGNLVGLKLTGTPTSVDGVSVSAWFKKLGA